ncbi:MAG: hypothetical protein R3B57_11075 [Phycisphaerales bacterium]
MNARGGHRGAYWSFVGAIVALAVTGLGLLATTVVYLDWADGHEDKGLIRGAAWLVVAPGFDERRSSMDITAWTTSLGFVLSLVSMASLVVAGVTFRWFREEQLRRYHRRTRRIAERVARGEGTLRGSRAVACAPRRAATGRGRRAGV